MTDHDIKGDFPINTSDKVFVPLTDHQKKINAVMRKQRAKREAEHAAKLKAHALGFLEYMGTYLVDQADIDRIYAEFLNTI